VPQKNYSHLLAYLFTNYGNFILITAGDAVHRQYSANTPVIHNPDSTFGNQVKWCTMHSKVRKITKLFSANDLNTCAIIILLNPDISMPTCMPMSKCTSQTFWYCLDWIFYRIETLHFTVTQSTALLHRRTITQLALVAFEPGKLTIYGQVTEHQLIHKECWKTILTIFSRWVLCNKKNTVNFLQISWHRRLDGTNCDN